MAVCMVCCCSYPRQGESFDHLEQVLSRKIDLLGKYIATMESPNSTDRHDMYYMPAESVDASAWERFDNVYQIHCPNIVFNNHNRNVSYPNSTDSVTANRYCSCSTPTIRRLAEGEVSSSSWRHVQSSSSRTWLSKTTGPMGIMPSLAEGPASFLTPRSTRFAA